MADKDFHVAVGGLTDPEGARAIARKLFESYDRRHNNELSKNEINPMMVDAYKSMQRGFNPTDNDLDAYFRVLDRNHDGRVTLQDFEQIAIKYLVGDMSSASNLEPYSRSEKNSYKYENNSSDVSGNVVKTQKVITTTTTTIHKSNYSAVIEQKLDVARRLFKKFDTDGSGSITEEEVAPLLIATYKNMGIDYNPSEQDVQEWMEMTDLDGDGQVTLEEYEQLILNSLKKAGIKIE